MENQSDNLHSTFRGQKIQYNPPTDLKDILGSFEVVATAPTQTPGNNVLERNKIYLNGEDYRFYTYANGDWYYVALTKV